LETRFGLGWPPYKNHPEWPAWLDDDRARTLFMSYATLENPHL